MTGATQDLEDLIREALEDSLDVDWNCTRGAQYVVRALAPLQAELAEAWEHVATLTKALTGLSGGGSEFFIRRRDRYIADAPFCLERVRDRERILHDQLKRLARELRAERNPTEAVRDMLAASVEKECGK